MDTTKLTKLEQTENLKVALKEYFYYRFQNIKVLNSELIETTSNSNVAAKITQSIIELEESYIGIVEERTNFILNTMIGLTPVEWVIKMKDELGLEAALNIARLMENIILKKTYDRYSNFKKES